MRRRLIFLAMALLCLGPAEAKPGHYYLLEDLQEVGDIGKVTDDSDMQMTFILNRPYWLVRLQAKDVFKQNRVGLDEVEDQGDQTYITSRWATKSVDGAANLFSGINQVRSRFEARVVDGGDQTALILSSRLQFQENGGLGWVDRSEREMRNHIRMFGTLIALRCRYPADQALRQAIFDDYQAKRIRHGRKGYQLPPEQVVQRETIDTEYAARLRAAKEQEPATPRSPSIADELIKLKQLLDEGVLTPEEFEAQKQRLLEPQ